MPTTLVTLPPSALLDQRDVCRGDENGVVGGQDEIGPELVGEAAQVGDAGADVLPGGEGVGDAEVALRAGCPHEILKRRFFLVPIEP